MTAKRLADFLASLQVHEAVLMQRMHDLEATEVFARMESYQALPHEPLAVPHGSDAAPGSDERTSKPLRRRAGMQEQEGNEKEEEMEALDTYEEYR